MGYKTQTRFYEAIEEFGWRNIRHTILAEGLTREEADAMEARMVAECRSNDPEHGYNVREGGFAAPLDPASRERIRQANIGKHLSEETKAKIRATTTGMPKSEEHARHISEGQKGRPSKLGKPVVRVEDGVVFPSTRRAATAMGHELNASLISSCCRGERKSAWGYHWRYVNDPGQDQRVS